MLLRSIACMLLLSLTACMGWYNKEGRYTKEVVTAEHPTKIRVTLRDSSVKVLEHPSIVALGDSVSGEVEGAMSRVALKDVTQVGIRRVSESRTTMVFFAVAIGAIVGFVTLQD